jgi:O-antigen/teichoic acid export membrane protein
LFGARAQTQDFASVLVTLLVVVCGVQLLNVMALLRALQGLGQAVRFCWDFGLWRSMIRESLPVVLGGVAEYVNLRADSMLVGSIAGGRAAGIYGAAYNLYLFGVMPGYALSIGAFPTLARYSHQRTPLQYSSFVRRLNLAVGAYGLLIAMSWGFVSPYLLSWLYGAAFQDSIAPLQWLIWAIPLVVLNRLAVQALNASGHQQLTWYATLSGVLFNVLANLWAVPRFGYMGAALTTVLTEGIVWCVALIGLRRTGRAVLGARHIGEAA